MEFIFERFPYLGKVIVNHLNCKSLVQCRLVNKIWKHFIDQDKTIWIRIIEKHIGDISEFPEWQKFVSKTPTKIVKEFAIAAIEFYKSKPARYEEKWCPLHIASESGSLYLCKVRIWPILQLCNYYFFGSKIQIQGHSALVPFLP